MNSKRIYAGGLLAVIAGVSIITAGFDFRAEDYSPRSGKPREILSKFDREARGIKRAVEEWYLPLKANQNTGTVDPDDVYRALAEVNQLAGTMAKASLPIKWEERGPDNVGGRTRAFLIDRNNHLINYAGGVSGGLWKSTNGGQSWYLINDNFENNVITCIAQTIDGTIYFGTGEQAFLQTSLGDENSGFVGNGVYKQLPGDSVFTRIPSTATGANWVNTYSLAADPNSNRIYAGNEGGLYWSENGGTSWTKVSGSVNLPGNCREVKIASDGSMMALIGSRVCLSNNGKTDFTAVPSSSISSSISRAALAISPQDPNYLYVMTAKALGNGAGLEGVYQSKNKGQNWTKIISGGSIFFDPVSQVLTTSGQGWYDLVLAVDPRDKERIMMGGVQLAEWFQGSNGPTARIIASLFDDVTNPFYVHADKHAIVFDTTYTPAHVIVCTDGGMYKSVDNWSRFMRMNRGYNTVQFYGVAADRDGNVLGGAQDNGNHYINRKGNTKLSSVEVKGGDGFRTEISRIYPNYFFAEYVSGDIERSANKGESFSSFYDKRIGDVPAEGAAPFNMAYRLWERESDSASIMAVGLYGEVWFTKEALDFAVTPNWVRAGVISGTPLDIQFSANGNHIFIGTTGAGLYRIDNVQAFNFDTTGLPGATVPPMLTTIKLAGIPNGRAITGIAIDPSDSNRMVITMGNYGNTDYVFLTTNALDANPVFTSITNNLPKMPVYSAVIPANNPGIILVGTEYGVYGSSNSGGSWTEQNDGMARVPVFELRQYNYTTNGKGNPFQQVGYIYAATHGRGIFEIKNFISGVNEPKQAPSKLALNAYPNPANSYSFISFNLKAASDISVSVHDINGREVYSSRKGLMAAGVNQFALETADWKPGTYFVRVESKEFSGYQKLVVVH